MGDTMEETEPLPTPTPTATRRHKPQTLDVDVLTESSVATADDCKLLVTTTTDSTSTSAAITVTETENGARLVRNRTRTLTETRDCRDHSSDGLITTSSSDGQLGSGKCMESATCNNDATRRESLNSEDTSPSTTNNNFAKNLFSRSMRYSSSGCATTTKKCVLTLDGYSYVIGEFI